MSTPIGPGWYDDPDDQKAERWWDGQAWSPNRRRKQSTFSSQAPEPPPATYFPVAPPDPLPYPDPSAIQDPAYGTERGAYGGPPPANPSFRRQTSAVATSFGIAEALALLLAVCGMCSIASAFAVWGRVSGVGTVDGNDFTVSVVFPGIGDPGISARTSEAYFELLDASLRNTNPGWIAAVFGIALIGAAAAQYFAWNRKAVALAVGAASVALLVVCISHLVDLRSTFDDPPQVYDADFTVGFGLIATTALAVVGLLAAAAVFFQEQRLSQV